MTAKDKKLAEIARAMGIETLETRNVDDLDFYDLHVGTVLHALEAAYAAGREGRG